MTFNEKWLQPRQTVPVDHMTTAILLQEIKRLQETVALMEKRIVQLQGHDAVYCQDLKPCAPSPNLTQKGNADA